MDEAVALYELILERAPGRLMPRARLAELQERVRSARDLQVVQRQALELPGDALARAAL